MRTAGKLLTAIMVGSFFIFAAVTSRAQVLISQVKISGTSSTDEFVELYNYSSSSVSLSDLALKRITGGGKTDNVVSKFDDSFSIGPFGYFLVAHPDYSPVDGINADFFYTKKSCESCLVKNNGIVLINKNFENEPIDVVVWGLIPSSPYSCGLPIINFEDGKSAVRLPNTDEGNGLDTDNCYNDFVSNVTSTPRNSFSSPRPIWLPIEPPTPTPETTSTPETPTTTPTTTPDVATTTPNTPTSTPDTTTTPAVDTSAIWPFIKINEFVSDPESGNEWVELYNPTTSSLDLAGGFICDSYGVTSTYKCKTATGTILAGDWLMIDLNSSAYLNNGGDSVILRNPSEEIIDRIDYSGDYLTEKGQALARVIDGADFDNLSDWAITTQLTPGAANVIVVPVIPLSSGGGGGGSSYIYTDEVDVPALPVASAIPSGIIINEIYPNPPGSDALEEFIEIKNTSTQAIDLSFWKIGDSARSYNLSGMIQPGQIIFLKRDTTKIALNNSTEEEVKLFYLDTLVDFVSYTGAAESRAYARDGVGAWQWTGEPTPGEENEISVEAGVDGIVWKIKAPSGGEIGEMLIFDVEDSADARGGDLEFVWNFSDGVILYGGEVERAFSAPGEFSAIVSATSTNGSGGSKAIKIMIGPGLSVGDTGVIISEVCPNPAGDDSKEFIEIYNSGEQAINLSGWRLRRQSKQEYVFPENTLIQPESHLIFYRAVTRFSLNNQGDRVELLTRDLETADMTRFGAGPSGKSYNLFNGEWLWSELITPGQANQSDTEEFDLNLSGRENEPGTSKAKQFMFVNLAEARTAERGDLVVARGTVSALPGVFASQIFYISGEEGGLPVYSYKKDFPDLKTGDYLEVVGEISVASGRKRIKIKNRDGIDVLETSRPLKPLQIGLTELKEENLGALVRISGEVTEIKSSKMYVDDGQDEIAVYFKKGAGINKRLFQEGENVSVVGVLEESGGDYQLWPRGQQDIESLGPSNDLIKKEELLAAGGQKKKAEDYLTATIGGLTALFFGFVGRARGMFLVKALKKTGSVLLAVIIRRRG